MESIQSSASVESLQNFSFPTGVEEIVISHAESPTYQFKLNRSMVTIGRDNDNDIVLNVGSVSRHHARLEWREGSWFISDLGSTNGSFIETKLLRPGFVQQWSLGETVKIGAYELKLRQGTIQYQDRTQFVLPEDVTDEMRSAGFAPHLAPPQPKFTFNMWPTTIYNTAKVCVAIQNEGNSADAYTLRVSGDEKIDFSINEWNSTVPPGLERRAYISLLARQKPMLQALELPFSMTITAGDGAERTLSGKLVVDPKVTRAKVGLSIVFGAILTATYWAATTFLL